ncbi:uncharacterized [Tachysurus ichikawai]
MKNEHQCTVSTRCRELEKNTQDVWDESCEKLTYKTRENNSRETFRYDSCDLQAIRFSLEVCDEVEKIQRGEEEAFRLSETELSLGPRAAHSTEMKPEIEKGEEGKAEDERWSTPES